jgi:hypothetical protein
MLSRKISTFVRRIPHQKDTRPIKAIADIVNFERFLFDAFHLRAYPEARSSSLEIPSIVLSPIH